MAVRPLYQDPFAPVLLSSEPAVVSQEQKSYVKKILDLACSDSKFAEKAYAAITRILAGESVVIPTITSLTPGSATVGDPDFLLHVHGTGFTPESVIVFNGSEEPTAYVSGTELTTGVNMATVSGASTVPVAVLSSDGVLSAPSNFVFQDQPVLLSTKAKTVPSPSSSPFKDVKK